MPHGQRPPARRGPRRELLALVKIGIVAAQPSTMRADDGANPRIFMAMANDGLFAVGRATPGPRLHAALTTMVTGVIVALASGFTSTGVLGRRDIGTLSGVSRHQSVDGVISSAHAPVIAASVPHAVGAGDPDPVCAVSLFLMASPVARDGAAGHLEAVGINLYFGVTVGDGAGFRHNRGSCLSQESSPPDLMMIDLEGW